MVKGMFRFYGEVVRTTQAHTEGYVYVTLKPLGGDRLVTLTLPCGVSFNKGSTLAMDISLCASNQILESTG